jgi:hypothetical protein
MHTFECPDVRQFTALLCSYYSLSEEARFKEATVKSAINFIAYSLLSLFSVGYVGDGARLYRKSVDSGRHRVYHRVYSFGITVSQS